MSENAGTKQRKENVPSTEQLEAGKKWLRLVAQARSDKTLKQRLMGTPIAVLREHGINVRQGLDVHVVENTNKVVYLTLPAVSELSDRELDGVVGGTIVDTVISVLTMGINALLGVSDANADILPIQSRTGNDGSQ